MKLKDGMILHEAGGEYVAVATGDAAKNFNGMIRNNESAQFIMRLLLEETTEAEIVDKMLAEYDAEREIIEKSVCKVIEQFRQAGLLNE